MRISADVKPANRNGGNCALPAVGPILAAMPEQDLTRKTPSAAEVMRKSATEKAAHDDAVRVVERWNAALAVVVRR